MAVSIPEGNVNDLIEKAKKCRIPLVCDFEITFKCNLRCVHCFHSDKAATGDELSYKDICRILDEIVEEGCLGLTMTGGEVLLQKNFFDIYNYAFEKGLLITVFTNGTLITPEIADYFQSHPPYSIEISLYGTTKGTYESITKVPGSFERCINGIALLIDRGIHVNLKTVAMTLNVAEITEMKKYASKLGVGFRVSTNIYPRFDFSREACKFRLAPKDAVKVMLEVHGSKVLKKHTDKCGGGISSFHIDPYGNLSICLPFRVYDHNLCYEPFRNAWQTLVPTLERARSIEKCLSCEVRSMCDQCPAWAYLENRAKDMPIGYVCKLTKMLSQNIHQ